MKLSFLSLGLPLASIFTGVIANPTANKAHDVQSSSEFVGVETRAAPIDFPTFVKQLGDQVRETADEMR